jgi:pyruvate dehydrogenase (quinone)
VREADILRHEREARVSKTVSDAIVEAIVGQGVRQVFGVVGDALNSFTDAIRRADGIDWVGVRHEEVGAFAAGAQAQLAGSLGVCAGTVGPGAIHMLNGLYDAAKSHAPVLAIAGQVPLSEVGGDYFQEVDNDALFRNVALFTHTITSTEQVPRVVNRAIEMARNGRGVAVLSLPGDVGSFTVDTDLAGPSIAVSGVAIAPDPGVVSRLAALLSASTKTTILAGLGSRGARSELIGLADRLKAPIVATLKAKEFLDWDNPFNVGQSGLIGNPAAADALRDADVLLMVGTDFPYREYYPTSATVIQIDDAAGHIGRRTSVDLGVVGDARQTLRLVLPQVKANDDRGFLDKIVSHHQSWTERQQRLVDPSYDSTPLGKAQRLADNRAHLIRPEAVASIVNELAAEDAIFTTDTGMSTVWLARFIQFREGQRLLGSFNLGSMANAMPQALGAQALYRDRQVIAFCGDGGLTMLLGDLLTLATLRLPVKLIVFDNRRLGMVKLEMEQAGLPEFGTVLDNPDLAAVATSLGLDGLRIEHPDELRAGLMHAFAADGPVLVDILTNPDEIALPPHPTAADAWGFAIAKIKEAIRSRDDT